MRIKVLMQAPQMDPAGSYTYCIAIDGVDKNNMPLTPDELAEKFTEVLPEAMKKYAEILDKQNGLR